MTLLVKCKSLRAWRPVVAAALFVISAAMLFAQDGPENLTFDKFGTDGVPEAWHVWNFQGKASDWVQVRHDGCRSSTTCVQVKSHLEQTFPAAPFWGRTVRFSGWYQSEFAHVLPAAISMTAGGLHPKPERREAIRTKTQTNDGWEYEEYSLFVDPDDSWIEIGLNGSGTFETFTFAVLPGVDGPAPEAVRQLYPSLDEWISTGQFERISSVLFKDRSSGGRPFDTRAGLKALSGPEIKLTSRTSLASIGAVRDDLVRVNARCELQRRSGERTYRYILDYQDLWLRTVSGWKLIDSPPARFSNSATSPTKSLASSKQVLDLPGLCGLPPPAAEDLTVGPSDFTKSLLPGGELKALMLFVDFPDAIHEENAEQVYETLVPESVRAVSELSYGLASLSVNSDYKWRQLPESTSAYNTKLYGPAATRYIRDAIAAAKNDGVDVSKYNLYYVVSPNRAYLPTGALPKPFLDPTVAAGGSKPVQVAVFSAGEKRGLTLFHETAHLFGLPDVYVHGSAGEARGLEQWDVMARLDFPLLTGWNRAKLGWVQPKQLECVDQGLQTVTLTPLAERDGFKIIAVPVSPTLAYVAELRELVGVDIHVPEEAVLVYTVDASIPQGSGPMSLLAKLHRADAKQVFENNEMKIELVQASLGAYTVRVARKSVLR